MPSFRFKMGDSAGIVCYNDEYLIEDRTGRVWLFEWHHFCGPTPLNKRTHDPIAYPAEGSPFWEAVMAWHSGGKKTSKGKGGTWALWKETT